MSTRILVVEDDQELRSRLCDNLQHEGYETFEAWTVTEAMEQWRTAQPALVVLDLMLPGRSGFQLLREMRASGFDAPVLILSARGEIWDKVKGFKLGCDDYLVKPFSIVELLARIAALLRRTPPSADQPTAIQFARLTLDLVNRQLICVDQTFDLSVKEFQLISYLVHHPNRLISRSEILREVWHTTPKVLTRTIDVYISSLRKKMKGSGCELVTVYNSGYRLKSTD